MDSLKREKNSNKRKERGYSRRSSQCTPGPGKTVS